jgi:hypothetical protein
MRVDRRCWARAVHQDMSWWGFKGIHKPSGHVLRHFDASKSVHAQIVLADEHYMETLNYEEAKYIAASVDWAEDWHAYAERRLHRAECCPHGSPEEQQAFADALQRMLTNEDERFTWACEVVDGNWTRDTVEHHFQDEESIFYFLKEHPVDSVWLKERQEWQSLDNVIGFCPSCNEPLLEINLWNLAGVSRHAFNPECDVDVCVNSHARCLFDERRVPRAVFECAGCLWVDATEDVEGDETFLSKHGRPFNWPPGAPYPPRRSFSGYPMDVPPHED